MLNKIYYHSYLCVTSIYPTHFDFNVWCISTYITKRCKHNYDYDANYTARSMSVYGKSNFNLKQNRPREVTL